MARRYGGRYSPGGARAPETARNPGTGGRFRGRRPKVTSVRARLLYLFPVPLLFAGLGATLRGSPIEAVVELGAFLGLVLSAWLINEGLRAEIEFNARTVARPPALPRKLLGSALTALSVFAVAAFSLDQDLAGAFVFGLLGGGASLVAFGPDPMRAKGLSGPEGPAAERAIRAIEEAETVVADTLAAARRIGDRGLEARLQRLGEQAREVFRSIERDPRDLSRARRFLSVYLVGLRDATRKFADLRPETRAGTPREQYEALLADMETSFAARRGALLEERTDELEIEIEVLRERLQQDGLTAR